MSIIVWRINMQANQLANAEIEKSLQHSSVILKTSLQSRFLSIEETAKSLARDGRLLPRIYEGDIESLKDLSGEFKKALDFDILFITDNDGILIARSDKHAAVGSRTGKSHLFKMALQGHNTKGFIRIKGELLQVVSVPVFDNVAKDIIRGSIALAYRLSPQIANEINSLTVSDIGFFAFGYDRKSKTTTTPTARFLTQEALISPLTDYFQSHAQTWQRILDTQVEQNPLTLQLGEETFHAVLYPLRNSEGIKTMGFVIALRSRTELLAPFLALEKQVWGIGLVCLFMASILAWLIAGKIARPIIALVSVTKDIQEGHYPENLAINRHDEVGILYQAVHCMGKSLKEKAELENYLANISDSLDSTIADMSLQQLIVDEDRDLDTTKANNNEKTIIDVTTDNLTVLETVQNPPKYKQKDIQSTQDLVPGCIFSNRYKIIKVLGKGAMGIVYLAKDQDLQELVALKVIIDTDLKSEFLEQFKEEIRLARRITHRNVLRTYDFGVSHNLYYISMEYMHGYDLNVLIKRKGALDTHISLMLAKQICSAMIAAHNEGIIHRDLKPQNMMINKQGILKIMDFGLAMRVKLPTEEHTDDALQTKTIAGTPAYMAPEQFCGGELDSRTDIYAIGMILYKVFTGRAPFIAQSLKEMMEKQLREYPPHLYELISDISPKVDSIIMKAIAKDKAQRFQSVQELQQALQDIS